MAHQPDPEKEPDLQEGLIAMRRMHLRAIAESGLTQDEMLYPENWPFVEDILSYVAVGARSVENQQHRLTISGMDSRYEKSHQWRFHSYVEFSSCLTN